MSNVRFDTNTPISSVFNYEVCVMYNYIYILAYLFPLRKYLHKYGEVIALAEMMHYTLK